MHDTFSAYVFGSYDPLRERWNARGYATDEWEKITEVRVTVSLRPGHSSRDHMFDVALRSIADKLREEPIYWTIGKLKRAVFSAAGSRYGLPEVEVDVNWTAGAPPTYRWPWGGQQNLEARDRHHAPPLPHNWRQKCEAIWRANDRSLTA